MGSTLGWTKKQKLPVALQNTGAGAGDEGEEQCKRERDKGWC